MDLSIILTYKSDRGVKDKHLKFIVERYKLMLPDCEIIVSKDDETLTNKQWLTFNKSKYLNRGVVQASRSNVLLVDIDLLIPKEAILEALELVKDNSIIMMCSSLYELDQKVSSSILTNEVSDQMPPLNLARQTLISRKGLEANGCYMITKDNYLACGGHDERFVGWGAEDNAFIFAAVTMIDKPYIRLDATIYHLWHPRGSDRVVSDTDRITKTNLYLNYKNALYDKGAMMNVIKSRDIELTSSTTVDFYASHIQYFDHIAPIWIKLPTEYKGTFYIHRTLAEIATARGIEYTVGKPTNRVTLVSSYDNYMDCGGPVIFMEHGIGHTYSNENPYFAGGIGKDRVVLFLDQHQLTRNKNASSYPKTRGVIIGTPKMDEVPEVIELKGRTVCLSFHWNNDMCPETISAFSHYESVIKSLAESDNYKLLLHGHPREASKWDELAEQYNIERVRTLREAFEKSDVYVCDNSSSMYEFAATDRPVIVLNAPWYRKSVHHGIRFWKYIPGPQVDDPKDLDKMIRRVLDKPNEFKELRAGVVRVLYPFRGEATQRAVDAIVSYINNNKETSR